MKRNLNQKLINLIEYYNLINADLLISNSPIKRNINNLEKILFSLQSNGEYDVIEEIPEDELRKIEEELKKSGYI